MKKSIIAIISFGVLALIVMATCNIETAYGPTPYFAPVEYDAKSSSTLTIATGTQTILVEKGLPVSVQQKITISPLNDKARFMEGLVSTYNAITGEMVVNISKVGGSGTFSRWGLVFGDDPWLDSLLKRTSLTDSLTKAANELPSLQAAYVAMKFGMFLHFSMSTFDRCCCPECYNVAGEWGRPASATVVPDLFKPTKLNCGQWADVAKSAGCKYMVLTTKHHDGFCLWDSKYTTHDAGSSSWNIPVKRDVLKEYADSARARGLKVGFYYSIWDKTNSSKLPFIKGQLAELLTNYGEISCIWFDGWKWMVGYSLVPYDTVRSLIKRLQPRCLIVENNHYYRMQSTEIVEFEMPIDGPPQTGSTLPTEACQTIRTDQTWFWHQNKECDVMPAQSIIDELTMVNSRNASYLLDLTPDTTGLIPQCVADRMKEVGQLRGVSK